VKRFGMVFNVDRSERFGDECFFASKQGIWLTLGRVL